MLQFLSHTESLLPFQSLPLIYLPLLIVVIPPPSSSVSLSIYVSPFPRSKTACCHNLLDTYVPVCISSFIHISSIIRVIIYWATVLLRQSTYVSTYCSPTDYCCVQRRINPPAHHVPLQLPILQQAGHPVVEPSQGPPNLR